MCNISKKKREDICRNARLWATKPGFSWYGVVEIRSKEVGRLMTERKRTSLSNTVALLTPSLQYEGEDANENFISLLTYMPQ